jgi:predicted GNAT family acetyltransferase
MAVTVEDDRRDERYEVRVDDQLAGVAEYRRRPSLIAFVHTQIDPRFEGQGLAGRLVAAALDDARAAELAVLPFCPFVRGYIERHPAYRDLVPAAQRAAFGLPADG